MPHAYPWTAEQRYENRVHYGIGVCASCGATVYVLPTAHGDVAGWHEPGKGVDHRDWERHHRVLPKHCDGLLLRLPAVDADGAP